MILSNVNDRPALWYKLVASADIKTNIVKVLQERNTKFLLFTVEIVIAQVNILHGKITGLKSQEALHIVSTPICLLRVQKALSYGNSLSRIFGKNSVKVTVSLKG